MTDTNCTSDTEDVNSIESFADFYKNRSLAHNVISIVKQANILVMRVYTGSDITITMKDDNSPVTQADQQASRLIWSELKALDPKIPIICEENTLESFEKRKEYTRFWIVDPLDGTKEFIKRNGEFTINIALVEKQSTGDFVPVFGVVSVPAQGLIYCAEKGYGAWYLNETTGGSGRLECKPFDPEQSLTVVCSRSHMNEATKAFIQCFIVKEVQSFGSSIKFMKLCENQAQLYPRLHPCMEWDIAAADAILHEAGGRIMTPDESPIVYNKPDMLVNSFIAYGCAKSR